MCTRMRTYRRMYCAGQDQKKKYINYNKNAKRVCEKV